MRLIDADNLKYKNLAEVNGKLTYVLTAEEIDNAPTVAVNCKECDGYEAGHSAGLKDAERPQSEIFPMEIVAGKCPIEAGGNCPLRPQGKWIKKIDNVGFISHICSECGAEIEEEDPCDNKFCWNCGAKMESDEE